MFTINQIRRAKTFKVMNVNKKYYMVRGYRNQYDVKLNPKPSCQCWHFVNKTVHDIEKGKGLINTHWCSHILAVLYKINYMGIRKYMDKMLEEVDE